MKKSKVNSDTITDHNPSAILNIFPTPKKSSHATPQRVNLKKKPKYFC